MMILLLGFIVIIAILSFTLTFYFRQFALQKSIIDIPNERSSHQTPIPRGGGVVFVGIFYILLSVLWLMHHIQPTFFLALLGGIPVALIGYFDDVIGVTIYWRFFIHLVSAIWSVSMLGIAHSFFCIIPIMLIVWFINFYNFMDGIDGIAATQGIYVSGVAGVILLLENHIGMSLLCFGVLSSLIGFLYWNWEPAKIFMGDIGSGFLGYFFGTLMFSTAVQYKIPAIFWLILMAIFLCDATYTLLYRMIKKKKWYLAHCEHVYQRLVQSGFGHAKVTLALIAINSFIVLPVGIGFLDLHNIVDQIVLVLLLGVFISAGWIWLYTNTSRFTPNPKR